MIGTIHQEAISLAYLQAISSIVEVAFQRQIYDYDSCDVELKKKLRLKSGIEKNISLHVQVKSCYSTSSYHEDDKFIYYYLKMKNYNDLISERSVPIILALLILPVNYSEWVNCSVNELILKNSMYWFSLNGMPTSANKYQITLSIPKENKLNPTVIIDLLTKVGEGILK